jgi:hypothetical protein
MRAEILRVLAPGAGGWSSRSRTGDHTAVTAR